MALESAVLLLVLGLIVLSISSICFLCICLTSTPIGGLIAVALGFWSMNYLNSRSRRRADPGDGTGGGDLDGTSAPLRGGTGGYSVVSPHQQIYFNQAGGQETVAEAYLVAPLASVVHATSDVMEDKDGIPVVASAPPPPPSDPDASGIGANSAPAWGDYGMFRDVWAAILFVLNLVLLVYLAVYQIFESLNDAQQSEDTKSASSSSSSSSSSSAAAAAAAASSSDSAESLTTLLGVCLVLSTLAITVGGSLYLTLLIRYGESIITGMLWLSIGLCAAGSVTALLSGQLFAAIVFGIFTALSYWFLVSCRDRIVFASAVLKTATTAVKEHYAALMGSALLMLFAKCLYFLVWGTAFFSVFSHSFDNTKTTTTVDSETGETTTTEGELKPEYGVALFLMSISLYWGSQVFANIVASTVSGTLAVWWFQPRREAPVRGSLFRACTTSFGSICLGSLIVAVLHALRNLLKSLRERALNNGGRDRNGEGRRGGGGASQFALLCVLCLGEWLLAQIEALMLYFNRYAFVYNAAYGTNFATSGAKVMDLFRRRGWSAIINDDLVANAFLLGNLALGVGVAVCGVLVGLSIEGGAAWGGSGVALENAPAILGVMGFVLGVAVGGVMTHMITSAVASVFVYFAEDPMALQRNHGQVYDELVNIWSVIHPTSLAFMPAYSSPGGSSSSGNPVVAQAFPV